MTHSIYHSLSGVKTLIGTRTDRGLAERFLEGFLRGMPDVDRQQFVIESDDAENAQQDQDGHHPDEPAERISASVGVENGAQQDQD